MKEGPSAELTTTLDEVNSPPPEDDANTDPLLEYAELEPCWVAEAWLCPCAEAEAANESRLPPTDVAAET